MWGATVSARTKIVLNAGFNPRAPCGARPRQSLRRLLFRKFQSTRPVWGATFLSNDSCQAFSFQSTRPVWGATHAVYLKISPSKVSIHAPRVGRDDQSAINTINARSFNPRAPCGARLELRLHTVPRQLCFNPRAPCGARLYFLSFLFLLNSGFQSTRPVWGATNKYKVALKTNWFQSTRPVWGATLSFNLLLIPIAVSIHAPRVGRDGARSRWRCRGCCFNPRAPCGARPFPARQCCPRTRFNPRAPCGARPAMPPKHTDGNEFQSTRPVWGATHLRTPYQDSKGCFNPRAPCGARPYIVKSSLSGV